MLIYMLMPNSVTAIGLEYLGLRVFEPWFAE